MGRWKVNMVSILSRTMSNCNINLLPYKFSFNKSILSMKRHRALGPGGNDVSNAVNIPLAPEIAINDTQMIEDEDTAIQRVQLRV